VRPVSARRRLLLSFYPPTEGVAAHVLDLLACIDYDTWDVTVACLRGGDAWSRLQAQGQVRLHPLRGVHGRPHPRDGFDLLSLARLVGGTDVIHAHSSKAGFLTRLAAASRGGRKRTVFTPHGWSFWLPNEIEARLYLRLERLAAHWCRRIIAVSRAEQERGLAAGVGRPDQYRVIPNGIDLTRFDARPEPDPGRILFVGRLAVQKRPELAVRAFAELHRLRPEARLDIVGDGPLRPEIDALVSSYGLRGSVKLLGARADVPVLLAKASCLILTSSSEGCPLTVIEAMASGVPVVSTPVGGVPELVADGETGLLTGENPAEIAAALASVVENPERARRLGATGRIRARRLFTRERMAADTLAVYDEISTG
jgi:glycosyltransferase involved in cell wall biosynthesis